MPNNARRALTLSLFEQATEIRIAPCVIASTSPPLVTLFGVSVPFVPEENATYVIGHRAIAVIPRTGSVPMLYQIGL